MLEEGRAGRILSARIKARSYLPDWHPDEDYREMYSAKATQDDGAVLGYIHEKDYARWLFVDAERDSGIVGKLSSLDIEPEDTASIIAKFEFGSQGEIHLDYVQQPYSRSCNIVGEEGKIRWGWIE